MRLLVHTRADRQLGLGHAVRCRSLVKALRSEVPLETAMIREEPLPGIFEGLGVRWENPDRNDSLEGFDLVIIDLPGLSLAQQEVVAGKAHFALQVNDDDPGPLVGNILVRPNLLNLPKPASIPTDAIYLTGEEFLILDPAYSALRRKTSAHLSRELLVCFGGSDPRDFTATALAFLPDWLKTHGDWSVHLVMGSGYPYAERVQADLRSAKRIRTSIGVPELAESFSKAGMALISGGTLLYEACALGVPALVLCQNQDQAREVAVAHDKHAAMRLDDHSPSAWAETLSSLARDKNRRTQMSTQAKKLCGAEGTSRVTTALKTILGMRI